MTKKKDIQIRIITGCISREGGIGCHLGYQNIDFVLEVVVVVVVVVKNLVVVVVIVVVVVSRQLVSRTSPHSSSCPPAPPCQ